VTDAEPFAAVLPPDPTQLHALRHGVASWLSQVGVDRKVRDAVVLATNEAAASAMMSPGDVFVDATCDEEAVTVVVTSADGWTSPDDDLGGQRMRIVREIVENVSFEKRAGRPRLRFRKPL
jgi:anti-sigma regulatory factor (Ser/Thr protein kinase)